MSVEVPGYVAGTWAIDPVHSEVSFVVRHMMVSKVRGRFDKFEGTFVTGESPLASSVTAKVDLTSINTGQEQRDAHIRSADFFEVEKYPEMTFVSSAIKQGEEGFVLEGDLTIKDVTKKVTFDLEVNGFGPDAYGGTRARLLRDHQDQPQRLRTSTSTARSPASPAAWRSARASRSPWRSRASCRPSRRHHKQPSAALPVTGRPRSLPSGPPYDFALRLRRVLLQVVEVERAQFFPEVALVQGERVREQ